MGLAVVIFTLLAGLATPVTAQSQRLSVDLPVRSGAALADLKYNAMQQLREYINRDLAEQYPQDTRVSIYLDVQIDDFLLRKVDVYIDGYEVPETREYTVSEAATLLRGSTHRVLRSNFSPGTHYIRVVYTGQEFGDAPDDEPLRGEIGLTFEVASSPQEYIFPVVPQALRAETTLVSRARPEVWQFEDARESPGLGLVRYYRDLDRNYDSLREMLRIAGPVSDPAQLPYGYHTLMAHVYLDFGMREYAVQSAAKASEEVEREEIKVPSGQTLQDAWLRIAELDYNRRNYENALEILAYVKPQLEVEGSDYEEAKARAQRLLWLDIQSRTLMALDEYTAAIEILEQANDMLDDEGHNVYFLHPHSYYLRYNYAVALIKAERTSEAYTRLNELGEREKDDAVDSETANRANLALAYALLRAEQGATAKSVFQRLPLQGLYSNNALLGLGWTELAPAGSRQGSGGLFGLGLFGLVGSLPRADLGSEPEEKFNRALVAWDELSTRHPKDAAVQEVMVAIPFAMQQLGYQDEATGAYIRAIEMFEQIKLELQSLAAGLERGAMSDTIFYEDPAYGLPATRWVEEVRSSYFFRENVDNHAQVLRLAQALKNRGYPSTGSLVRRLEYAAGTQERAAQDEMAAAVRDQIEQVDYYRLEALLGLNLQQRREGG